MPHGSSSPPSTFVLSGMERHPPAAAGYLVGRSLPCTCAETTPLPAVLPLGLASFLGLRISRPPFSLLPITDSSLRCGRWRRGRSGLALDSTGVGWPRGRPAGGYGGRRRRLITKWHGSWSPAEAASSAAPASPISSTTAGT